MDLYLPINPGAVSVQRIVSGDGPDEYVVYSWVNNAGDYPEPAAWYFQKLRGSMKLVDYALLDEAELASERVAREFSSAFTGTIWDNYLAIFETDYFSIDRNEAVSELERLSDLRFPNSVRHRGLLYLAQYADMMEAHQLALDILDKLDTDSLKKTVDIPALHMIRAQQHFALEEYEQALHFIDVYNSRMPGSPSAAALQGSILFEMGRDEDAKQAWLEALKYCSVIDCLPWDFHDKFTEDECK